MQNDQPSWKSLDKLPVPEWFKDVKFGVFITWGVYSVPAYAPKGGYAEWYQHSLMSGDTTFIKYHKERFEDRSYNDLARDFKSELFNPDEWAQLFKGSGAKHIVPVTKHHDGFTWWQSKESNRDWAFSGMQLM